jgi:hypothetical protein
MNFKKLTITLQDENKFRLLLYTIILIAGSILWFFRILIYLNLFENPHDPTGGDTGSVTIDTTMKPRLCI